MRAAKMSRIVRIGLMAATGVLVIWRASSALIAPGENASDPEASPMMATVETAPVRSHGDGADDAAIWLHPTGRFPKARSSAPTRRRVWWSTT